jgi:hypothetical protein
MDVDVDVDVHVVWIVYQFLVVYVGVSVYLCICVWFESTCIVIVRQLCIDWFVCAFDDRGASLPTQTNPFRLLDSTTTSSS